MVFLFRTAWTLTFLTCVACFQTEVALLDQDQPTHLTANGICVGRIPIVCKYEEVEHNITPLIRGEIDSILNKTKKVSHKRAVDLFEHALRLAPQHPVVLAKYAAFLELHQDYVRANHMFLLAATFGNEKDAAMEGYSRTLPRVLEEKEKLFRRIEEKARHFKQIPHDSLALKRALREMRFKHVYHTNALEGNTLSLLETRYIIETRRVDGVRGSVSEVLEVISTNEAIDFVVEEVKRLDKDDYGLVVSTKIIEDIHKIVLNKIDHTIAGVFRDVDVMVSDHNAPSHELVPNMMTELSDWLHSSDFLHLHPIERAALAHFQLVWIHPFVDGNGRTSRLLMNLFLLHAGFSEAIIELEDRLEYYETLRSAHPKHGGDTFPFIFFVAKALEKTLDSYLIQTRSISSFSTMGEEIEDLFDEDIIEIADTIEINYV